MRHHRGWLWLGIGAGTLALLALAMTSCRFPWVNPLAREWWQLRHPRHYTYDVRLRDFVSEDSWRVEVLDGQMVQVLDLTTNQPPKSPLLSDTSEYILVDQMFRRIGEKIKDSQAPQCADPLPQVCYDIWWGYPKRMRFEETIGLPPCSDMAGDLQLEIDHFRPLP